MPTVQIEPGATKPTGSTTPTGTTAPTGTTVPAVSLPTTSTSNYTDTINRTPTPPPTTTKTTTTTKPAATTPPLVDYGSSVPKTETPPPVVLVDYGSSVPKIESPQPVVENSGTPSTTKTSSPQDLGPAAPAGNIEQPVDYSFYVPNTSKNPPPTIVPSAQQEQQAAEAAFAAQQVWLETPEGHMALERYQEPYIAANAAATPSYAVTYTEGGIKSTVIFESQEKAARFIESLNEPNIAINGVKPIPGPGAGPAPGSIAEPYSQWATGAFQSLESWFESLPAALRVVSKDEAARAATVKNLNGLSGGLNTNDVLSAILRFDAGIVEGATFYLRPKQWAQLAGLPVSVLANPGRYAAALMEDGGGIVIEGLGGFAGGYAVGAAFNAAKNTGITENKPPSFSTGIDKPPSFTYERYPVNPETGQGLPPIWKDEYALKAGTIEPPPKTLAYEGTIPYKPKYLLKMYSGGIPLFELDEAITTFITNTVNNLDTPTFKAFAKQVTSPQTSAMLTASVGAVNPIIMGVVGSASSSTSIFNDMTVYQNRDLDRARAEMAAISSNRIVGLPPATGISSYPVNVTPPEEKQKSPPIINNIHIDGTSQGNTPEEKIGAISITHNKPVQVTDQTPVQVTDQTPIQGVIQIPIEVTDVVEPVIDEVLPEEGPPPKPPDSTYRVPPNVPPWEINMRANMRGADVNLQQLSHDRKLDKPARFDVKFRYGKRSESMTVEATSFREAYSLAQPQRRINKTPVEVTVRKR